MTTIGEAIALVQEMYSKGVKSKDSRLPSRQIYAELLIGRGTILRQRNTKKQRASRWVLQVLSCVELIKALPHECPCVPTNGCKILRTKYKLPAPVTGLDDMLITSVTTLDGGITLDPITFENVKYNKGKKYTADKEGYYIRNQYGFVVNRTELKATTWNGLFDDPLEVHRFPSICGPCEDCECLDIMDYEFPIDKDGLGAVVQLASNRLIIMFGQMKQDNEANANDDIMMGNQMIHQPNNQQDQ